MSLTKAKNHKRKRTESYGLGDFVPAAELRPTPGDLLEINRTLYTHWAVYVGNRQIVHVQGLSKHDLDIPLSGLAKVKIGKFSDVCGNSSARVNNKEVPAKERGLESLASEKVINAARKMIGKTVPYNLVTRNCEHFVTEWKYGESWSDQAEFALSSNGQLADQKDRLKGHLLWLNSLTTLLSGPQRQSSSCVPKSSKLRPARVSHVRKSSK